MKLTIEVDNVADAELILRALTGAYPAPVSSSAGSLPVVSPKTPEEKNPEGAAPEKPKKGRKGKKAKPAEEPAEDSVVDPEVVLTEDDVKKAVRTFLEVGEIEGVKQIFSQFGAHKLSDLKEEDYPKVIAALTA